MKSNELTPFDLILKYGIKGILLLALATLLLISTMGVTY